MKISKQTIDILKNFSGINQNIFVANGNTLRTMSVPKNIFVEAQVQENFEQEFGIYNLSEFLGVISLFSDPEVEFSDKFARIKEGKNSVTYHYANKEVLVLPPDRKINIPQFEANFTLTKDNIDLLKKSASVLSATDVFFVGKDGVISALVGDPANSTSNKFSIEVGTTNVDFNVFFKVENLKMIQGDYDVHLSKALVVKLVNQTTDYVMHIALDSKSSFSV